MIESKHFDNLVKVPQTVTITSLILCLIGIAVFPRIILGVVSLALVFLLLKLRETRKVSQMIKHGQGQMELTVCTQQAILSKLESSGSELISELERDALLKRVRDAFSNFTKAASGYLVLFNQNKNHFTWGIGLGLSILKMKSQVIPSNDQLMGRILAASSPILFHEMESIVHDGVGHIKKDAVKSIQPAPEVLISVRMKMKDALLGVQFLIVTRAQAEDIKENEIIFKTLVNQATLALGSAIQREFAINDRMTMMYNHEYFVSRLREEIAICERNKGRNLTLLMMDIDHFKKFNDTYGHQIGDFVLIETASIYRDCVRMSDVVARYGGEEFSIILPQTKLEDGIIVAEKIRKGVEEHEYNTEKGVLHVTISIGVCEWTEDQEWTPEKMVKISDEKLYVAKDRGRNCVIS